eukprot:scaffold4736_cov434-Prasinococcus_capsulatus_cf.AAC.5
MAYVDAPSLSCTFLQGGTRPQSWRVWSFAGDKPDSGAAAYLYSLAPCLVTATVLEPSTEDLPLEVRSGLGLALAPTTHHLDGVAPNSMRARAVLLGARAMSPRRDALPWGSGIDRWVHLHNDRGEPAAAAASGPPPPPSNELVLLTPDGRRRLQDGVGNACASPALR